MKKVKQTSVLNSGRLPNALKLGVESLYGLDLSEVRVHLNSPHTQLNNLAYAQGSEMHVAPGQEEHLPHETWRVVQQAQGRATATMQMKDRIAIDDANNLECEADSLGEKAVRSTPKKPTPHY